MNVLAISVHPDDETLGCGGTLLRHREEGDTVDWAIATQTHSPQWSQEIVDRKAAEVDVVASGYSMRSVHKLGLPTTRLDVTPLAELIEGLRKVIEQVRPAVVYLPHYGDVHSDHHVVFLATFSVLKAFYMRSLGVRRVLSYETLSSTEAAPPQAFRAFVPNVYKDITPHIERKIEIMGLYTSESQPDPLPRGPRAIRALARFRGATVGVEYAEAFMLVREVV
jgi:LmbE family N-acetylglucosaminyl deacetylase